MENSVEIRPEIWFLLSQVGTGFPEIQPENKFNQKLAKSRISGWIFGFREHLLIILKSDQLKFWYDPQSRPWRRMDKK